MIVIKWPSYYETEQSKEDTEAERLNKCITMVHKSVMYKPESFTCRFTCKCIYNQLLNLCVHGSENLNVNNGCIKSNGSFCIFP